MAAGSSSATVEPQKLDVVLVTGAAGFIGGHLCERLLEDGHTVVAIDSINHYYDPAMKEATVRILEEYPKMHFYKVSVVDKERLYALFGEFRPNVVCHLAAQAGVRYSLEHLEENIEVNILGTTNILEASRDFGVANVVCASSSSVYGAGSTAPFDESQICDKPISPYACSKRCCELFGYTFHHLYKLNVTMLRFFTVYGPRGRPDMAAFRFIKKIHEGYPIDRYGDGSAVREFTYVSDVTAGIVAAIHKPMGYAIINLGGGCTYTVNEFISIIEQVVGKKAIIRQAPEQPGDVQLTSANQARASDILGFSPKISLAEGIQRTYEWFLASPYNQLVDELRTNE
eukprot:GEMP01012379.1.p1 GENE.GEMP01012379.1~~GEMP01012379.1.p1  ORF type:complete len:343 (+),score=65.95 GEMP01012379.1:308-1336(+)